MDIRSFDNLRALNDCITQTEIILRQRPTYGYGGGLTHTPYTAPYYYGGSPFGLPAVQGFGCEPVGALTHSPYTYPVYQNMMFSGGFGMPGVGSPFGQTYPSFVDPFAAQRGGITHTAYNTPWGFSDLVKQQQLQAIVARQQALEAMWRNAMPF